MKYSLSQACTMPGSFADDVAALAEADCPGVEIWLTKLETHLQDHSVEQTRELLAERKLTPAAASYQGGLLLSQGEARKAHFEHFRERLELLQALAVPTMVVVADLVTKLDEQALGRSAVSLKQAAQWAAGFGVTLALEFRAANTFCSSLDTAVGLVEQCGEPNVGVCLDAFHFSTGPSKEADLRLLTRENLAFVQLCDVAGLPRELASDSDRVLPGDGDFLLGPIVERLREIGYDGWVSLELFNPTLWELKPSQVTELGLASLRRVCDD